MVFKYVYLVELIFICLNFVIIFCNRWMFVIFVMILFVGVLFICRLVVDRSGFIFIGKENWVVFRMKSLFYFFFSKIV